MRLSLQTAFSQQKLHLKGPSEHSGNTQEFTNQFTKLAWLETMLLCVDPAERYFLIYQTLVGLLQAVQRKITPGRECQFQVKQTPAQTLEPKVQQPWVSHRTSLSQLPS